MTRYEAIKMMESSLRRLVDNNVDIRYVRYVEMYHDYERFTTEGHKNIYIVHYLSEQYEVNAATIYRVVKRMRMKLT